MSAQLNNQSQLASQGQLGQVASTPDSTSTNLADRPAQTVGLVESSGSGEDSQLQVAQADPIVISESNLMQTEGQLLDGAGVTPVVEEAGAQMTEPPNNTITSDQNQRVQDQAGVKEKMSDENLADSGIQVAESSQGSSLASTNVSVSDQPNTPPSPANSPTTSGLSSQATPSASSVVPTANLPQLLQILVNNQAITAQQAQEINSVFLSHDKPLEEVLHESELVNELSLTKAKAEINQIPFIAIAETGVAPEAMNRVEEAVARRYQVLPFAFDEELGRIKIAMVDPLDINAINFLEQKTGLTLEPFYATPSEIKRLIGERYAQDLSSDVSAALEESETIDTKKADLVKAQQGGFIRAAPINKIVDTIMDFAIQSRASDIHIEPMVEKTRVRYRVDGVLTEKLVLPKTVHDAVVSRIKILSDLKIDERRLPQDGRFDFQSSSQDVDLRISTMPSIHGEKVVMRLLQKNTAVPSLEDLGLSGLALQNVNSTIKIPHGIFLVTGPTGSGKTTTLYSILNIINTPKVNIMTLEDPVEYQTKGVTQVQVHAQAGLTFANGLRSFLRQDPDIIMVGEIRDKETAELSVQASLTGHLVFSTLHTNSAAGALPRLMDMGIEPFLLSSSIILAMGQRVVRKINEDFKEEYQPEPVVIEDIKKVLGKHFDDWCNRNNKDSNNITLFRARADRPQTEPEYKGRVGIFEVMEISDEIKHLINTSASSDEIENQAMKHGMMKMKQDGYIKVLEGITTIEEVLRVAEES